VLAAQTAGVQVKYGTLPESRVTTKAKEMHQRNLNIAHQRLRSDVTRVKKYVDCGCGCPPKLQQYFDFAT
jgi:hypothetical protein